jgi:hypothetical protein
MPFAWRDFRRTIAASLEFACFNAARNRVRIYVIFTGLAQLPRSDLENYPLTLQRRPMFLRRILTTACGFRRGLHHGLLLN